MKRVLLTVLAASVLLALASCSSSPQAKGDRAFNRSKHSQGDMRRMQEKEAYMFYKRALEAAGDRIPVRLRERFCEMNLVRGNRILNEGAYNIEAIPLFLDDMNRYYDATVSDSVKNGFAGFMARLADSCLTHGKLMEAVGHLNRGIEVSADKAFFGKAKSDRIQSQVEQYLAVAKAHFEQGKENKDAYSLVRSEFWAQFVLLLDSANAAAQQLLSAARQQNLSVLSAYKLAVDDMPSDTSMFNRINKQSILMAVVTQVDKGTALSMVVDMYNYSNNPQRLKAESFSLVDVDGKKYTALGSSTLKPEILDQSYETKDLKLNFPRPSVKVKKLVYDAEFAGQRYHSEKYFF